MVLEESCPVGIVRVRGLMLQRVRQFWGRLRPAPLGRTEGQQREGVRDLVALQWGEEALAQEDAAWASRHDPGNPLSAVHDLWTARVFVLASYPRHSRPHDLLLERAFSLLVLHIVLVERDPYTHLGPFPSRLDEVLAIHTGPELVAMLRASPVRVVRESARRWGQSGGPSELDVQTWFQHLSRRYGGRWQVVGVGSRPSVTRD